ncbi:MAG TPA: hypothetical protein VHN14_12410 [Kofleriaceae bacterium]|nr:hypothetical protein [Kofleriaceae bacterium]
MYAPTTFTTDSNIEPITGAPIAAGEVTLQPGIYRLPGGATLVAKATAKGQSYAIVPLDDTKGGFPDPPLQAVQQYSTGEIEAFLGGAGAENEI